jgi:hypothetical protein
MKGIMKSLIAIAICSFTLCGSVRAALSPPSNISGAMTVSTNGPPPSLSPSAPFNLVTKGLPNAVALTWSQSTNQAPMLGTYVLRMVTLSNAPPPATTNNFIMLATMPPGQTNWVDDAAVPGNMNYYFTQSFNNN